MTTRREKIAAQDVILAAIEAAALREKHEGREKIAAAVLAELARLQTKYGVSGGVS